jgi:RHS repeat-associated protein
MSLKNLLRCMSAVVFLALAQIASAATWSEETHQLAFGDFNADGKTDVLYVARHSTLPSGIALSNGSAPSLEHQTWDSSYLGIPWHGGIYKVYVADFNDDDRADILLQRQTQGDHYLLLANSLGKFTAISQTIPSNLGGQVWSADAHRLVTGDFNGDGRSDVFLQAVRKDALSAVFLAGTSQSGIFTSAQQTWGNSHMGFEWSVVKALVHAGDFNADGKADLLVQAMPDFVLIDYDIPFPIPRYRAGSFGIAQARAANGGGESFYSPALQIWDRNHQGVDWSASNYTAVVGDFNGDGRADVFLQGNSAGRTNRLMLASSAGQFTTGDALLDSTLQSATADQYRLNAANIDGTAGVGMYLQAKAASGTNYVAASITGSSAPLVPHDPGPLALATDYGRTQGAFSVSGGSARYTVPIWTPPGPNGVQPAISLSYNSQVGNSTAGVGWGISGLPSITRCPRTIHQDGTPAAVDYTANDRFCINGVRLRIASGTYGQSGSVYYTEIADYSRIKALTSPEGPIYFLVEAKDGMKYEFGYTAWSRATANLGVHTWWLNKAYDRNGNNYLVSYTSGGPGVVLPSSIMWTPTSHGASTYRYTMTFSWHMDRSEIDSVHGVTGGTILINRGLLQGVQVVSGQNVVRHYVLTHDTSPVTSRSLLTSIKECAGSGESNCLRPITFTYQPGQSGLTAGAAAPPSGAGNSLVKDKYDFNGDGKDDLAYRVGTSWWVAFGATNGFTGPVDTGVTSSGGFSAGRFLPTGRKAIATQVGTNLWIYRWDDATSAFVGANTGISLGTGGVGIAIDHNGDGLDDLITAHSSSTYLQIRSNTSSGSGNASFASSLTTTGTLPSGWRYAGFYQSSGTGLAYTDVNGDGRSDVNLVLLYPGEFGPPEGNTAAVTVVATSLGYTVPPISEWIFNPAGDLSSIQFNGDSCTDRVIGTTVYIAACNGGWASTKTVPSMPLQLLDWDGDGKTDFLVNNGGTFGVYRSTGNGFTVPIINTSIPSAGSSFSPDLDGDGLDDLVQLNGSAISYWTHTPNGYAPASAMNLPDLLANVEDGFGVSNGVTYTSTAWSNYSLGATTVYPLQEAGPAIVPLKTTNSAGNGSSFELTYGYSGLRSHATRRAGVGFQRLDEVDSRNSLTQRTYYEQQFPVAGMVAQSELLKPDGVSPITRTVATNNFSVLDSASNNQRYFTYRQGSTATEYEVGGPFNGTLLRTTTTANSFEFIGGSLYDQVVTTTEPSSGANGGVPGGSWTSRTYTPTNQIHNDTANWCMGRSARVEKINSHNQIYGGQLVRTRNVSWDLVKCRPTQSVDEPGGGSLQVTTAIGYDDFGNVNSTSVTGAGMPARSKWIVFADSTRTTGQFPLSEENALSQTSTMTWNYDLGVPMSSTDPNGISVTWLYDAFGRRTRENFADGTYTTWQYMQNALGDPRVRMYVDQRSFDSNGANFSIENVYLDQFDRPVSESVRRADGNYNFTGREFDALGRVTKEFFPYVNGTANPPFATTSYDLLNRPYSISRPQGDTGAASQSTTIYHEGLTTRILDAQGKETTRISNAAGQLRRSRDHNSYSQVFDYDAFGNPVRVQDSEGNPLQSSVFNVRGMLTQRTDMSMGTWNFTPNALGEVISQIDAKNQITNFSFDLLGRLTSRAESEGVSYFNWGSSSAAKNIGQLASVSGPGYSEQYAYDYIGRPQTTTISADTTYEIGFAYNSIGAIDAVTYPESTPVSSGSSTRYRFVAQYQYSNGYLLKVRDANAGVDLWSANSFNARDQVTQETLGTHLVTIRSYDAVTGWLEAIQTGAGGSNTTQNLQYEWDLVGNLTKRRNVVANLTEEFVYDNLYRLQNSELNDTLNLSMAYDALGNITSKSDVGSYNYHASKRHQVVSAGGLSYGYDANGNMTTGRSNTTITWTSYNYPSEISNSTTGIYTRFWYTPGRAYWKQEASFPASPSSPAGIATTIYVGGLLEKVTTASGTDYRHLVHAGGATIVVSRQANGVNNTFFVTSDHLGSSSAITDASGAPLVQTSYDAFGRRRDSDWSGAPSAADMQVIAGITRRGYTGHTMVDNLEYVHMNGRAYDSILGRFLSADPLITNPTFTQNYNRYSYVYNNSLARTDPTGFAANGASVDAAEYLAQQCMANADCKRAAIQAIRMNAVDRFANNYVSEVAFSIRASRDEDFDYLIEITGTTRSGRGPTPLSTQDTLRLLMPATIIFDGFFDNKVPEAGRPIYEIGMAVIGPSKVTTPVKTASRLWTNTRSKSSVKNAYDHFKKHAAKVGAVNSVDYLNKARSFLRSPPQGTLMRIRENGDVVRYHPESNTYGVMDSTGLPRTFFKPDPAEHKFATNMDYFLHGP